MTTIALVDDHSLIRNALKELINRFDEFEVIFDVSSGQEFVEKLQQNIVPDIALVDINMPIMDGFETTHFATANFPNVKVLALTVNDDDESVIKMLRAGAVGYLLKDSETSELKVALFEVATKGYYHNELVTNTLMKSLTPKSAVFRKQYLNFQGREEEFLKFVCSELTYKEIADKMELSPRTIDGYRENLFQKLAIKSRVGLVLFAIKNEIVTIN